MSAEQPVYRARILGCGSSGGVPRIDGDWGACDPREPRNRRMRCSLLVERAETRAALDRGKAVTRLLIDTSPDLRAQLLAAGVTELDAVAFTHTHADQAHGIDDVRALVYRRGARLDAYMSAATHKRLMTRFGYIFETPDGSGYPPLMSAQILAAGAAVSVDGPGGALCLSLFDVEHGGEPCSGVSIGPIRYTPDVNGLDDAARAAVQGAGLWICDALRDKPHPSHAHVDQALCWISDLRPDLAVLTNLHVDLDYRTLASRLPNGVRPAFDGMEITLEAETGAIIDAPRR